MSSSNTQNNTSENSQTPRAVPSASNIDFSQLHFSEPNSITNTLTITIPQPTFTFGNISSEPVSPVYSPSIPSPIATPMTEEVMASPSSTPHPMEPIPLATPQQIEFTDSEVEMIEEATTEELENEAETDDEMPELITDSDVEDEPSEDVPLIPEEEEEVTENKHEKYECGICYKNLTMDNNVVTKCDHHFCNKCFYRWIQTNASCPMCRTQLACEVQLTDEQLERASSEEYGRYVYALERATITEAKVRRLESNNTLLLQRQNTLRMQIETTKARTDGMIYAREMHANRFNPKTEKLRKFYRSSYSSALYGEFMKGYHDEEDRLNKLTEIPTINFGLPERKRKIINKSNTKIKKRNKATKTPGFDFSSCGQTTSELNFSFPSTIDMTRQEPVFVFGENND